MRKPLIRRYYDLDPICQRVVGWGQITQCVQLEEPFPLFEEPLFLIVHTTDFIKKCGDELSYAQLQDTLLRIGRPTSLLYITGGGPAIQAFKAKPAPPSSDRVYFCPFPVAENYLDSRFITSVERLLDWLECNPADPPEWSFIGSDWQSDAVDYLCARGLTPSSPDRGHPLYPFKGTAAERTFMTNLLDHERELLTQVVAALEEGEAVADHKLAGAIQLLRPRAARDHEPV